jgi:hypothetical protein
MKIDFKTLNENLKFQRVVINQMGNLMPKEEYTKLLNAIFDIMQFNDSMIELYETSEVELK